jgi:flagellar basal body-associated protein FliL
MATKFLRDTIEAKGQKMADADNTKEEGKQEVVKAEKTDEKPEKVGEKPEKTDEKASARGIFPWIIMFVVVVLCGGAGLALSRLFAGSRTPETAEYSQEDEGYLEADEPDSSPADSQEAPFYDLESVVANLNEPGVTRYVRATLTLVIGSELNKEKGRIFLDEKKPLLKNWLTVYLANLTLEDVRGQRNLKRIQSQILDAFNEELFPGSKPLIKRVLFKEFAIQ